MSKYCKSCEAKNKADAKFCDECGKPFKKSEKTTGDKPSPTSEGLGLEVVSLVTSILGFTCLPIFGFVIAIITGLMSKNAKTNKYAKVGVTIGSLGLIIPFFVLGVVGIIGGAMEGTDDLYWAIILGAIAVVGSGVGLFFFIRWMKKPAA